MTLEGLLAALDLPIATRVGKRVPKKMLLEKGAHTAADKRVINEGIEELQWLAALKPATVGVIEYRDEEREYLEIAILGLTMRAGAKVKRLLELVHRAVPYPVLLLVQDGDGQRVSLTHKRGALNDAGKTILDGDPVEVTLGGYPPAAEPSVFLQALALTRQPRTDLRVLYQGWMDTLLAQQVASLTGAFEPAITRAHAESRRAYLRRYEELTNDIARLRNAAAKESQVARQVDLNLQIQRVRAEQVALLGTLKGDTN